MTEGSIPRRYAKALFELAQEASAIDRVGEQLDAVVELARANDGQVLSVMSNPGFTASERRAVLDLVLPRLGLASLVQNFVRLVLDKDRFEALPDVAREY
ncbi:MAG: ATP synthase F1 subunit delta, partial [Deltaproteobacteria bacterium]|nr:ATP synthase F1 subunit delta [Deltaproteobacteria bacterium]